MKRGLPWYKCDPAAFNDGMMGLTRSERGVYVTVLNAIYIEGGPVRDEPLYWSAIFGCAASQWLKDRDGLILKGKLYAVTLNAQPCLMNRRAAAELAEQEQYREIQAKRGAAGGAKSRGKSKRKASNSQRLASAKPPLSDRQACAKEIKTEREREIYPYPVGEDLSGKDSVGALVVVNGGRS